MLEISDFPGLNAVLNGLVALLLVAVFFAFRRKRRSVHKALMLGAFVASTLFLASSLSHHFHNPQPPFQGLGLWPVVYFKVLIPHVLLAVTVLPLALAALNRGLWGRFDRRRRGCPINPRPAGNFPVM